MDREQLEKLLEDNDDRIMTNILLWGTGNTAQLYKEGLQRLEREGFQYCGYVDNNTEKWGEYCNEKVIYSPNQIKEMDNVFVLVLSPQVKVIRDIGKQLDEMSINWCHIDEYILKKHKKQVLECYDLFDDEESKMIYAELVRCRIEGDYPDDKYVSKGEYFSFRDFGEYNSKEVFVDCGAFVGDTIESYIISKGGVFDKIVAFEPDKDNIKAIMARIDRLKKEWNLNDDKFEICNCGISDTDDIHYVERYDENNGLGSKMISCGTEKNEECKVVSIDEYFNSTVSFIKADIESYEFRLLQGAKNTISLYSPKLAICIYHNSVDFYQIPLLIKAINPSYRLAVRHYTHVLTDTVLYAYEPY